MDITVTPLQPIHSNPKPYRFSSSFSLHETMKLDTYFHKFYKIPKRKHAEKKIFYKQNK